MTKSKSLNAKRLHEMFEYINGELLYRQNPGRLVSRIGTRAGWIRPNGYRMIIIDGEEFREHRVIWVMHYGDIDNNYVIDHIDGNECNNVISNLRLVSETTNRLNQRMRKDSLSPYKGICWDTSRNKWMVRLKIGAKTHYLGRYNTAEEAAIVYDEKLREIGPPHSTFNFPKLGERSAHTGEIV